MLVRMALSLSSLAACSVLIEGGSLSQPSEFVAGSTQNTAHALNLIEVEAHPLLRFPAGKSLNLAARDQIDPRSPTHSK